MFTRFQRVRWKSKLAEFVTRMSDHGACPLAQKWHMVCYFLVQRNLIQLYVTPVQRDRPPLRYKLIKCGLQLPVIAVSKNLHPMDYNTIPPVAIKHLLGSRLLRLLETEGERDRWLDLLQVDGFGTQTTSLSLVSDLMKALNLLLLTGSKCLLNQCLDRLNEHLKSTGGLFMHGRQAGYVDCALAPKLQHVRVAGAFYREYSIPSHMNHVWGYLLGTYSLPAFRVTCPTDKDILLHHLDKVAGRDNQLLSKYKSHLLRIPLGHRLLTVANTISPQDIVVSNSQTVLPVPIIREDSHTTDTQIKRDHATTESLVWQKETPGDGLLILSTSVSSALAKLPHHVRTIDCCPHNRPFNLYRYVSPVRYFSQKRDLCNKRLPITDI